MTLISVITLPPEALFTLPLPLLSSVGLASARDMSFIAFHLTPVVEIRLGQRGFACRGFKGEGIVFKDGARIDCDTAPVQCGCFALLLRLMLLSFSDMQINITRCQPAKDGEGMSKVF